MKTIFKSLKFLGSDTSDDEAIAISHEFGWNRALCLWTRNVTMVSILNQEWPNFLVRLLHSAVEFVCGPHYSDL